MSRLILTSLVVVAVLLTFSSAKYESSQLVGRWTIVWVKSKGKKIKEFNEDRKVWIELFESGEFSRSKGTKVQHGDQWMYDEKSGYLFLVIGDKQEEMEVKKITEDTMTLSFAKRNTLKAKFERVQ